MSYPTQLILILLAAFVTLFWKVSRAIAKEKIQQQIPVNRKIGADTLTETSMQAWTAPVKQNETGKYLLIVFVLLSYSCFGNVQANFSSNRSSGCPPLLVNFTNLSSNSSTCFWDFGNGNTSTLANPVTTFLNAGLYQVKLLVKNGTQTDSVIKSIRVFAPPVVNFSVNKPLACLTDTLHFQSNVVAGGGPVINYAWGFGNGAASSNPSPQYRYNQTGSYNITLVVVDSNGCSANKTIAGYVKVFPSPVAAFTASPQTSCNASQLVSFTNQSSGSGLSYFWNLDDSVNSTAISPTHLYQQEIRTVILTVTDSIGCHSQTNKVVSATNLIANFDAVKTTACTGERIAFNNLSNFTGTSWFWNFGDGTTATAANPNKRYTAAGHYTVSFIVRNGTCADSITRVSYITIIPGFSLAGPAFTADTTITCGAPLHVHFTDTARGGVNFLWNFGNGDSSHLKNPTEFFAAGANYNVTLTITDSNGCAVASTLPNLVQTAKPKAKFSSDTLTCSGGSILFNNQSTGANSFLWYFGDGDTSSAINPHHTYLHNGIYTVKLTAFNRAGCDTSVIKSNYIHVDSVHVGFHVSSNFSPCPPFVCVMQNTSAANVIKFLWDFGDGYKDTAANPVHIYFYPGQYAVKLIGYTRQGCTDTVLYNNLITVQGPVGNFVVGPQTGCAPVNVSFVATVSNTRAIWCDFNDGSIIADSLSFTHAYTLRGVYHPQFILTDSVGCSVSYPLDSVTAYPSPVVHNIDTAICAGAALNLAIDSNSNSYNWLPARYINCDTCATVAINTPDSITYRVKVTNYFGCSNFDTIQVNVEQQPVLNDSVVIAVCPNDTCHLFAGNATRVTWWPATFLNDTTALSPVCVPSASTVYSLAAYSNFGCRATAVVKVQVNNKLDISVADSAVVCTGASVQLNTTLNVSVSSAVQYSWSPALYLDNAISASPVATLKSSTMKFQVVASNNHCMADTASITVYVDVPVINVPDSMVTTPFTELSISATAQEPLTYFWQANDHLSCTACSQTFINPATTQMVYVEGKSTNGCIANDSVLIVVNKEPSATVFIPNAFTPNGDGNNDVFEIYGNLQGLEFLQVEIFNRWGELIFESNNLHFAWDGTYKGIMQNPGVFTYQLHLAFNDSKTAQLKTGSVTLVR